jgi:guanine deaminase
VAEGNPPRIRFAGDFAALPADYGATDIPVIAIRGVLLPPFLDLHTHLPQHPLRGRFTEGIFGDPPEGRLLAGLERNVFPAEARHCDTGYAEAITAVFAADTLRHGVVGGAAYGTVHAAAAHAALCLLSPLWSLGMVLMNFNCPEYLRTDCENLDRDVAALAERFGRRFILTDRFAVSVTTPLRRRASELARVHGLRMQTHLNEQRAEKRLIETQLYPGYDSYTDVYRRDGLLEREAILAHCIQMTPPEWAMLSDHDAAIAHCPTSNTLLGSGTLALDQMPGGTPYAICTDIGASPTCSLLAEMAQFLKVHRGRSRRATPQEALYRATLAPAQILGLDDRVGTLVPGMPLSFVMADLASGPIPETADQAILSLLGHPEADARTAAALAHLAEEGLPDGPDLEALTTDVHRTAAALNNRVSRVVLDGETVYTRDSGSGLRR